MQNILFVFIVSLQTEKKHSNKTVFDVFYQGL